MSAEWTVRVANLAGEEVGQLSPVRLEAQLRYNDVGTWLLDADFGDRLLNDLLTEGASIVVYPPGRSTPLFAGPWIEAVVTEGDDLTVEVSGVTDEVLLDRRLASPDPDIDPPWVATTRQKTGPAHEVIEAFVEENAGQTAPVEDRRSLVVDPQTLTTPTVRWTATGQPLLELCQGIGEVGDVAFHVERRDGVPTFVTGLAADRSGEVVFAANLGTVERTTLTTQVAQVTHAVVKGDDVTALTSDAALRAVWGRIERLIAHGQSNDPDELADVGLSSIAEQKPLRTVTALPIEGAGAIEFVDDWNLGDKVTIRVGDTSVVDVIRQVTLTLEAGQAPRVQAALSDIGTPSGRALRRIGRRLSLVEAARS